MFRGSNQDKVTSLLLWCPTLKATQRGGGEVGYQKTYRFVSRSLVFLSPPILPLSRQHAFLQYVFLMPNNFSA